MRSSTTSVITSVPARASATLERRREAVAQVLAEGLFELLRRQSTVPPWPTLQVITGEAGDA